MVKLYPAYLTARPWADAESGSRERGWQRTLRSDYKGLSRKSCCQTHLHVDGADLNVVDVRQDAQLDGAAPHVRLLDLVGVANWILAKHDLAILIWVAEDVFGHLFAQDGRRVIDVKGATKCRD